MPKRMGFFTWRWKIFQSQRQYFCELVLFAFGRKMANHSLRKRLLEWLWPEPARLGVVFLRVCDTEQPRTQKIPRPFNQLPSEDQHLGIGWLRRFDLYEENCSPRAGWL